MKNTFAMLLAGLAIAVGCGMSAVPAAAGTKIGMVVWIGCDDVCRGVKNYVAEDMPDTDVVVFDAARDAGKLPGFVEQMRAESFDLAITWGTKVTLGIAGTLAERDDPRYLNDIPVVFTVVADPIGANIIESYDVTGRDNVTGTRSRVPETVNIKSIRRYMPDFDHLGILYNPAEPNSLLKAAEIEGLTETLGFELDTVPLALLDDGTPDPDSIEPGIAALKKSGVQFITLGSSAFLEQQTDRFTGAAVAAGLPVLTPYEHMVTDSEALMSVAARDYDVGELAGVQAQRILVEGISPGDLPVLAIDEFAYLVNMDVARKLDLYPPIEFLQFVEQVH
jgi:ABC-type uncharacterized transport system substrate-binding protein